MRLTSLAALVVGVAMAARAGAQTIESVATMPPNLALANYDTVPVGPFGGLEAGAYVARVGDPSAAWFNPAGLAKESGPQVSASGGVYQWIVVSPETLPHSGGSSEHIPNFVGGSLHLAPAVAVGGAFVTTASWLQQIDSDRITLGPGSEEHLGYSADSQFSRRVAAGGAAYQWSPAWRVGAGLAFSLVDLRLVQRISDRIVDGAGLRMLLVGARASGSAVQLRAQGGAQYEAGRWRAGAAVRTPELTLHREGSISLDGLAAGAASIGTSLFDPDAAFDVRQPWEIHGGVAYVGGRAELEMDVRGYTRLGAYPLISTTEPTRIYGDQGTDAPVVLTRPSRGLMSAADAVVDVTVGGHLQLLRHQSFLVHGGFATHHSPVIAADDAFNHVNLTAWNVGVSGALAKFQFALGVNLQTGPAADVLVRNVLNPDPVHRAVDVRTGGLIYSISYQF